MCCGCPGRRWTSSSTCPTSQSRGRVPPVTSESAEETKAIAFAGEGSALDQRIEVPAECLLVAFYHGPGAEAGQVTATLRRRDLAIGRERVAASPRTRVLVITPLEGIV